MKKALLLFALLLSLPLVFFACETEPCPHTGERIYYPKGKGDATCYSAAWQRVGCADCNYVWTETIGDPLPHEKGTWKITKEPTCTTEGEKTQYCDVCNAKMDSQVIPTLEHTPGNWIVTLEETCTTDGARRRECTVCKTEINNEVIPMTGHNPSNWIVTLEATCTSEGSKMQRCTVCETELVSETIPMSEHTPGDWIVTLEETCTTDGARKKECTECKVELKNEVIPAQHKTVTLSAIPATCLRTGLTEGKKCTRCETVFIEQKEIPMLEHNWVKDNPVEPTCAAYGYTEGSHCSLCGQWQVKPTRIDKLPHTVVDDLAVEATCTTDGCTAGSHCSVCKTTIVSQRKISALGHDYDMLTNTCIRCPLKELPEIKSVSDFLNTDIPEKSVYFLDYCISTSDYNTYYMPIDSNVEYIRFVANTNRTYKLYLVIADRSTPITIDFVNVSIRPHESVISCNSAIDLNIGFYGDYTHLSVEKAANGALDLGSNGRPGSKGKSAIYAPKANINITLASNQVVIYGGSGGDGGEGLDVIGPQDGGKGGNGGDGAVAIEANSITVNVQSGFEKSDLHIAGGLGGDGGLGGKGWFLAKRAASGSNGSDAAATSVPITYK